MLEGKDGQIYFGHQRNGKKHGYGKFYDKKTPNFGYNGSFVKGKREGEGIMKSEDIEYIGEFKNNIF